MDELPQMDGSCDACEPDEAQTATHVCHTCSFAFCPVHADRHANSTRHPLIPYHHEEIDSGMEGNPEMAMAAGDAGKRDTVTVERLRCKEHGQEGSLYCKPDEKIICVVCAVQGDHREHEIITLHEAYTWQKSRQGYDLLGCTQQMADKIKTKWTNPEMSTEELEDYVNSQFDELRRLVRLEERRTLHLVDLKEAFLTASAAEKIAEISVETERLQEEMANINNQLYLLEQAEAGGPAVIAEALVAAPGPAHRMQVRPALLIFLLLDTGHIYLGHTFSGGKSLFLFHAVSRYR
uniref:B box-type domain-containing protein n=1 Tax=Mola mola TaxID=94237 RepID=A0A3Q3XJ06_MOLML